MTDDKFRVEFNYDPNDLELILDGVKEIGLDHPELSDPVVDEAFIAHRIAGPYCVYAAGRINGKTVAFASAKPHGHGRADGSAFRAELELIYVSPEWRGKNYGDKVMRGLLRKLRRRWKACSRSSNVENGDSFLMGTRWHGITRFLTESDRLQTGMDLRARIPLRSWDTYCSTPTPR